MEKDLQNVYLETNFKLPIWALQFGYQKCESLHTFGPAVRDHFLLHFIVNGSGIYIKQNKQYGTSDTTLKNVEPKIALPTSNISLNSSESRYLLSKGEGFFISPNNLTIYSADQDSPWEYYWIGVNGPYAKSVLESIGISKESPCFKFELNDNFFKIFDNILNNPKTGYARDLDISSEFYKLLSNIVGIENKNNSTFSSPEIYLNSAVQYIQNNYAYDITVSKIADFIGIDRTYLYKIFMTNLSMSVEKYIIDVRLQNAQNLLTTTNYTILQIALSTGFYDLSHFSNSFRKHFSMSPSEYRKSRM